MIEARFYQADNKIYVDADDRRIIDVAEIRFVTGKDGAEASCTIIKKDGSIETIDAVKATAHAGLAPRLSGHIASFFRDDEDD